MKKELNKKIEDLEKFTGFPLRKKHVFLDMNEAHDENISYSLCQRFYSSIYELKLAIALMHEILKELKENKEYLVGLQDNNKTKAFLSLKDEELNFDLRIGFAYSILGDMYYLYGDYKKSAGSFIKSLECDNKELSNWVGFMFSLRALGKFNEFENMMFNLENVYKKYQTKKITKDDLMSSIKTG